MAKRIAIFPGSFDPFTKGHYDIVNRGLKIFDEIIVAIGYNSKKQNRYFEIDMMVSKLKETFENEPRVSIIVYNKLTSNLAKDLGAGFLLRGLRNTTDFEYENSISQVNKYLNEELESVFLITAPQYAAISSTIIREVHRFSGNVDEFLPYKIEK
ncbi:pantetheine-phosphate adenylyltransferase [Marivirga sp.]|uniref:pantetheine-phosphate adenylyltransferase n=1 Tax=Marivirga sp. TaxID=2018662 RepID=UPI002D7F0F82|nr:pantetheine-phosphate adenylyltransferase [Marivirga sp.]HET8858665.1 pantetheine-phosphate adenylyltransferase [Marivirga sp.]